jgi:hypothetical protein
MLHFKRSLAIIAALAGFGFIAPISSAQEVINIANTKGAQESTYFASVLGWKVVVGAINSQPAYCAAINNQAGSELRLGYGSGQWQVAVPYSSRRGECIGRWDLDGKVKGTYGQSDGKWTFLWLNLGERDAIMNAKKMIPMHFGCFDLSDEPVMEPLETLLDYAKISNPSIQIQVKKIGEFEKLCNSD